MPRHVVGGGRGGGRGAGRDVPDLDRGPGRPAARPGGRGLRGARRPAAAPARRPPRSWPRRRCGVELHAAARIALDASPDEREAAENDLTRQLRGGPLARPDPALRGGGRGEPAAGAGPAGAHRPGPRRPARCGGGRWCGCCGWPAGTRGPRFFDIDDPTLTSCRGRPGRLTPRPIAPVERWPRPQRRPPGCRLAVGAASHRRSIRSRSPPDACPRSDDPCPSTAVSTADRPSPAPPASSAAWPRCSRAA